MADPAPAPSGAGTPEAQHAQPELRVVKDDPAEGSAEVAVPPSKGPGVLNARPVLAPPDLLHTPPPSVQQLWDRARDARHLPESAGLKAAATAYVVVVAAPGIIASILYWALAHPARGAVLALVGSCVALLGALTFSAL